MIGGLRDRVIIGVMVYSFARVGAVVDVNVEDHWKRGRKDWCFRMLEKGGKYHEVPAHHQAQELVDEYLEAACIADAKKTPLSRSMDPNRQLSERRLQPKQVWKMVKRRARQAGLPESTTATRSERQELRSIWSGAAI